MLTPPLFWDWTRPDAISRGHIHLLFSSNREFATSLELFWSRTFSHSFSSSFFLFFSFLFSSSTRCHLMLLVYLAKAIFVLIVWRKRHQALITPSPAAAAAKEEAKPKSASSTEHHQNHPQQQHPTVKPLVISLLFRVCPIYLLGH